MFALGVAFFGLGASTGAGTSLGGRLPNISSLVKLYFYAILRPYISIAEEWDLGNEYRK